MKQCRLIGTIRKIDGNFDFTVAEELFHDITESDKEIIREHYQAIREVFQKYELDKIPLARYKRIKQNWFSRLIGWRRATC